MIEFLRRVALPLWADGRGGTTMEFGLVALPLTMLLIGVVEFGTVVRMKSALQYATAKTARCVVVDATLCGTTGNAKAYALTQLMGISVPASAFSITTEACGRRVTAIAPFPGVTHHLIPSSITVTASTCFPPL